jgi:hypothetical protein
LQKLITASLRERNGREHQDDAEKTGNANHGSLPNDFEECALRTLESRSVRKIIVT